MAPQAYADLEIYVLAKERRDDGTTAYRVELRLDGCQESGQHLAALGGIQPWDRGGLTTREAYGASLFQALFSDPELRGAWERMRGQRALRRVRLRVAPELPELHVLQWEALREPATRDGAELASSGDTPFSRYLEQLSQPGEPVLERPVRVLVAISNPSNLPASEKVDVREEFQNLLDAARDLEDDDGNALLDFQLLTPPCTLDAIRDALKQGYHALHYVGHGVFGSMADEHGDEAPQAALLLQKPDGSMARETERRIAEMFAELVAGGSTLRLVFLASCETARRDGTDAYRGLAPRLVQAGVPAVVAMQDLVQVGTARAFARTFYRQLLRHGQIDLACNEARSAVKVQALRGPDVPTVFTRLRSGELLRVRGRVGDDQQGNFWARLLNNIESNLCVPFLGPRVNAGILPRPEAIARTLSQDTCYQLADCSLASVAQFESYKDPNVFRNLYLKLLKQSLYRTFGTEPPDGKKLAQRSLAAVTSELNWRERSKALEACRIYHQLADLEFPLYVTTNVDDFMAETLAGGSDGRPGREVRSIAPRWRTEVADTQPPRLDPAPDNATPCVLHLNGWDRDGDLEERTHIALSEDDFLRKYVRLTRDQGQILPASVVTLLAQSSWLFLGYRLCDWEFRVVLQGLLEPISQLGSAKLHVGVQLDAGESTGELAEDKVQAYLHEYLGNRFHITVYWGSPAQFVADLHQRQRR